MLLEAIIIGIITYSLRRLIGRRINPQVRSFLSAGGLIPALVLVRLVFTGIKLPILGLLVVYLGMVVIEMLIPDMEPDQVET